MSDLPSPTKPPDRGGYSTSVVDAVPALFDQQLLKDEAAVEAMMSSLENHLADDANDLQDSLTRLTQAGLHLFQFVLSGTLALLRGL